MEKINWAAFSDSHARIREKVLELKKALDENSKRHLQLGLYMRLGMMESAIVTFDSKIGKSTEPLSICLVYELSLLLNAYYLNLAGSLDNIAWALTYYHNLRDQINEDNGKHRTFANLLGNSFLQKLCEENLQELSTKLSSMKDWATDVKNFRDPAAHRIPLYVPPATYLPGDIQQRNDLDNKASELIKNGKYEEGANLTYEIEKLGTHIPIFFSEFPKTKTSYEIAKQINKDHQSWLDLVEICLDIGFKIKCV